MILMREFEFYEEDGVVLAVPCDMEGGTFGSDLKDAVQSATEWLYETATDCLLAGHEAPGGALCHKPAHGGTVMILAVDCDIKHLDAVSAAQAARMLGVSRARVTQMCDAGQLSSWRDGASRKVLRRSVKARLEEMGAATPV